MNLEEFIFPIGHYEIVKHILNGRMITSDEALFPIIKQHLEYYRGFFKESFGFELINTSEVIYVTSDTTQEKFSRNIMLLLAVVTYEFSRQGKNLYEEFEKKHTFNEFEELIKNSSYKESCRTISLDDTLKACHKRNIVKIESDNQTFYFTSAINIFLNEAKAIAEIDIINTDLEEGRP